MQSNIRKHISNLIENNYSSGYAPFWELSFGEYYRSWHISNWNKKEIAKNILIVNRSGSISEKINNKKVVIEWELFF